MQIGHSLTTQVASSSKHKMSYADCFAAALAKQKKALLLTDDPEESQITIDWL